MYMGRALASPCAMLCAMWMGAMGVSAMRWRHLGRGCFGAALLVGLLGLSGPAGAEDPEVALRAAKERIAAASRDASSVEKVSRGQGRDRKTAEQRIADAVMLMGVKDYERAADVLNRVIEKYPNHPTAYADGINLLGETYFQDKQYLSAKRQFGIILDRQNEARFAPFSERAAVRLVDVALRMRDLHDLDPLFAKIGSISSAQSGLAYAKGKGLLAQGKLGEAASALAGVSPDGEHIHQARYLQGVIATQEATPPPPAEGEKPKPAPKGRYAKAIGLFREVTKLPPDTAEHRHVIDMAWLAIGRLLYESRQWTQSVEAYNRIGRESPEFGTMLFELAWVYVRLGDVVRAQRALEVLAVAAPNSQDVADAALLRGDLMLRAGQFEKSRKVYESVRGTYDAMQERLNTFLGSTDDPGVYFDTLSKEQLELFEQADALPSLVIQWAREGEDGERAFAIIDDVAMSRRLIKESNEMIERLNAVLSSPNRVRALPQLKKGAERGIGLLNSISMAHDAGRGDGRGVGRPELGAGPGAQEAQGPGAPAEPGAGDGGGLRRPRAPGHAPVEQDEPVPPAARAGDRYPPGDHQRPGAHVAGRAPGGRGA